MLQLNVQSVEDADKSLERIFKYLKESGREIIIAIDEFQQIVNYPEENVDAILRTHIQRARGVNFIFPEVRSIFYFPSSANMASRFIKVPR